MTIHSFVSLELCSRTRVWRRKETCRQKIAPGLRNENLVAAWNMHNFQLSFQRPFRNVTPLSRFIPWICDATLWYFCERTPTYFCGDPNHVRARGTNFRENGDGYFRDEDTVYIEARFEFFNVARCSLVTRSPFGTQRGLGTDIVPLGTKFLTYNEHM